MPFLQHFEDMTHLIEQYNEFNVTNIWEMTLYQDEDVFQSFNNDFLC